ncbi:MAG: hypothetical protein P4N41_10825 [Negativicutes bacterium]|nr:hypothetical protein [Negativicutes bacterium]
MYNYTIIKFSCRDVFRWCFGAGVCCGGVIGILLGLMDKSIGLSGGMFFGLLFGLFSGCFALIYAGIFNILSPYFGGLTVRLEPVEPAEKAGSEAPAVCDNDSDAKIPEE